jgi:MFS family permease
MTATPRAPLRSPGYVVGVLTLAYTFSFIDRQILNLLVGPIQRDLALTDTRMSLLQGIAFALFYTVMGLPLGRLADRTNRVRLIVVGITIWSLMTAACGLARSFPALFLARIGVGIGEAALSPAAYSLIRDYFPTNRLARAASVYNTGIHLGGALALFIGGAVIAGLGTEPVMLPIVGPVRPWQVIFFAVGLPGLLVALVVATIPEPPRGGGPAARGTLAEVGRFFGANGRLMTAHFGGYAILALVAYGAGAWMPTFLIRTYGWSPSTVGTWYGAVTLTAGPLGVVAGGWWADHLYSRGRMDATMRAGVHAVALLIPFAVAAPLMPTAVAALAVGWVATMLFAFPMGAAAAAIQVIAPVRIRAQVTALYLFAGTLIGLGLGPTAVALVTDGVFHDPAAVRYSLALVAGVLIPVSLALIGSGLAPLRALVAGADAGR